MICQVCKKPCSKDSIICDRTWKNGKEFDYLRCINCIGISRSTSKEEVMTYKIHGYEIKMDLKDSYNPGKQFISTSEYNKIKKWLSPQVNSKANPKVKSADFLIVQNIKIDENTYEEYIVHKNQINDIQVESIFEENNSMTEAQKAEAHGFEVEEVDE